MNKVIVTGATSFIGINLINILLCSNSYIYAIIRPKSENVNRLLVNKNIRVIEADLAEYEKLDQIINDKIDICYHLAWEGARKPYRDDELLQRNNYNASIDLMKCCKKWNVKVFLGAGSQAEYGKCIGKITEEYIPKPITEYGKAKLKACNDLMIMAKEYDIKFIWTRLFSVYGIFDYDGTLISSSIKKLLRNEELLLTECSQVWDFINVDDVAEIMYQLGIMNCSSGIYNIASGFSKPLKEFILDMKAISNSQSNLLFGAIPYGIEGIVSFEPVVDKLKNTLNWTCKVSFEEGIQRLIEYNLKKGNL